MKLNLENNLNFNTSTLICKIYHDNVIQEFELHVIDVKLESNKKKVSTRDEEFQSLRRDKWTIGQR